MLSDRAANALTARHPSGRVAYRRQDLYRELVGNIPVADGEFGRERWLAVLSHPGMCVLVAEKERRIVAMVTLHLLPNMTYGGRPYTLIENVVTARDHQGQGIGRRVMETAIARAWDADAYKIMLLTGKKRSARMFYPACGSSSTTASGGLTLG